VPNKHLPFNNSQIKLTQWAKLPKKQSVGFFDNMALYFECRINKKNPNVILYKFLGLYV